MHLRLPPPMRRNSPAPEIELEEEPALAATVPEERPEAADLIPQKLECPITHETLTSKSDIIGAPDGRVYDKEGLKQWLERKHQSPVTRELIMPSMLFNPVALKQALEYSEMLEQNVKKLQDRLKKRKVVIKRQQTQLKKFRTENEELKEQVQQTADYNEALEKKVSKLKTQNKYTGTLFNGLKQGLKRELEKYDEQPQQAQAGPKRQRR